MYVADLGGDSDNTEKDAAGSVTYAEPIQTGRGNPVRARCNRGLRIIGIIAVSAIGLFALTAVKMSTSPPSPLEPETKTLASMAAADDGWTSREESELRRFESVRKMNPIYLTMFCDEGPATRRHPTLFPARTNDTFSRRLDLDSRTY